uniref:Uncharacterized protein n=1 Tax=viral metagenome TaxID=1070528 RepID=A0A6M3K7R3_9ZZZZ
MSWKGIMRRAGITASSSGNVSMSNVDRLVFTGTETNAINLNGTYTNGIKFTGAFATHAVNFDSVTMDKTLVGVGSYSSPVDQSCTTALVSMGVTSDDADSWRYSAGLYIKGTGSGTKVLGLGLQSEYNGTVGADRLQGMASIALLGGGGEAGKLLTLGGDATAGMYAGWFKVGANTNCVVNSGSRVAALWVDNQMNCVCDGEEYAMFITCGGSKVDAIFGFETTSSGWTNLFHFDETAYDQDPVASGDIDGGTADKYLKVSINGTAYGIQLYAI